MAIIKVAFYKYPKTKPFYTTIFNRLTCWWTRGAKQAHAIDGFAQRRWLRLLVMRTGGDLTRILCL